MKNPRFITSCDLAAGPARVGKSAEFASPTKSDQIRSPGGSVKNKPVDGFYKEKILEQRALSRVPYPSSCKAFLAPLSSLPQPLDKEYCSGESVDSITSDDFTLTKQRMQLMRKSRPGQLMDEGLAPDSQRNGQWEYDSESDDESTWEDSERRIKVLNKRM